MFIQTDTFLAPYYNVIDKKTNERISYVQWADELSGCYEVLLVDNKGDLKEHYDKINNEWVFSKKLIRNAKIELVGRNWFFKLLKLFLK